ncbi:hypothetical protein KSP39_PZI020606 [Platanthera zijinensis]|uniref:Uncharacterized protein n=1 Tax=Platanthera zijinensis TaxID=2320716 RepID=A0AAP0B0E8_9ASPA
MEEATVKGFRFLKKEEAVFCPANPPVHQSRKKGRQSGQGLNAARWSKRKEATALFHIKQGKHERLGRYIDWFQEEVLGTQEEDGFTLQRALTFCRKQGLFCMEVDSNPPVSYEDLIKRANKFVQGRRRMLTYWPSWIRRPRKVIRKEEHLRGEDQGRSGKAGREEGRVEEGRSKEDREAEEAGKASQAGGEEARSGLGKKAGGAEIPVSREPAQVEASRKTPVPKSGEEK